MSYYTSGMSPSLDTVPVYCALYAALPAIYGDDFSELKL
jgi:hypothetical protein